MKKICFYILIGLFTFLIGCDKAEVDVTAPTIQYQSLSPSPITTEVCGGIEDDVFVMKGGESLDIEVTFSDDVALSEYKIDIHNNFDCHGHGGNAAIGTPSPAVENQTIDWTVLEIKDLEGLEESVTLSLEAPENVTTGSYHFSLQVLDEAGNDDTFGNIYTIQTLNPTDEVSPNITVTEPNTSNFSAAKGSNIVFKGQVTDDFSLSDGGNGVLFLTYTDLSSGNTFSTDKIFVFDSDTDLTYDFDFEYQIPNTLTVGNYRLSLNAFDGVRNVAERVSFEVEVRE